MRKEALSGLIVTFLLLGLFSFAFNIQSVKAEGTIYIRPDGTVEGTDKIHRDGDTYTFTDNIYDSIIVERNDIVIDGGGFKLQGMEAYGYYGSKGLGLSRKENVTVQHTQVKEWWYGIQLDSSSGISIIGNNITGNNSDGIVLSDSLGNSISRNIMTGNKWSGISLSSSSNNNVSGNTMANNYEGITLYSSSSNRISRNIMTNNENGGIYLSDSSSNNISGNTFTNDGLGRVKHSYQNFVQENTVNGKPLIYLEKALNCSVNASDAGQVILVRCDSVRVEDLNLSATTIGVQLIETNNSIISGNTIANSGVGIVLEGSSNSTIMENNITRNKEGISVHAPDLISNPGEQPLNNIISRNNITGNCEGVFCGGWSRNTTISENNIRNNSWTGISIGYFYGGSEYNTVLRNNITGNSNGVYLEYTHGNILSENEISDNKGAGISSSHLAWSNVISRNNITYNAQGISCFRTRDNIIWGNNLAYNAQGISGFLFSSGNRFYHNNLIENDEQVHAQWLEEDGSQIWDDDYPSGGNYWSDYAGIDVNSGSGQDQVGSDGIGDTPYIISPYSEERPYVDMDRYPLMNPWVPFVTATVDIRPDSLNLKSGSKWVTAFIELPAAYSPRGIDVSTVKLNGSVPAELKPIAIGDYDSDGVLDLIVKFKGADVKPLLLAGTRKLTITGEVNGRLFEGSDTIRVKA